jgi:hypothetical protein
MQIINQKSVKNRLNNVFTREEWNKCWSIYKGIFDLNYKKSINHI